MKKMQNKTSIQIIMMFLITTMISCSQAEKRNETTRRILQEQQTVEKNIMGDANYKRQDFIYEKSVKDKRITDDEVNWLIKFSSEGAINPNDKLAMDSVRVRALLILRTAELTQPQKDKVYQLALPLLSANATIADKMSAINTMRVIKDKRAIPYTTPFLGDSDKYVRTVAQKALAALR